jgi:hypothetical protein
MFFDPSAHHLSIEQHISITVHFSILMSTAMASAFIVTRLTYHMPPKTISAIAANANFDSVLHMALLDFVEILCREYPRPFNNTFL